jgi:hypothetical protein
MSAGSSTSPGGYREYDDHCADSQQFPVVDQRTPDAVGQYLVNLSGRSTHGSPNLQNSLANRGGEELGEELAGT